MAKLVPSTQSALHVLHSTVSLVEDPLHGMPDATCLDVQSFCDVHRAHPSS
jgi:hypothetical protein